MEVNNTALETVVPEITAQEPAVVETSVEVPAVEPVVETPKELITYSYQPLDDFNRPLGKPQVFKSETWEGITEQVATANKNLIKLNRELNKRIRLGDVEVEDIPADIARANPEDRFESKPLTPEEKVQLSRDLLDPEKFEEASARLIEASLGAKPEKIMSTLTRTQEEITAIRANEEAKAFVQTNPDYYVCKENFETLTNWMLKNNLAPIRSNFQYAFDKLKAVGLLFDAPIVREEPVITEQKPENSHQVAEEPSRITSEEPPQSKRIPGVASGLNRNIASDVNVEVKSKKLSVEEIERMDSVTYKKRLLSDPTFAKAVDEAYAASKG